LNSGLANKDPPATGAPLLERCNGRFGDLIVAPDSNEAMAALRGAETIGRPFDRPPSSTASPPSRGATRGRENGVPSHQTERLVTPQATAPFLDSTVRGAVHPIIVTQHLRVEDWAKGT